ncbi:hypothetical protein Syun_030272 [Stephania yunnanensis]|uniref:Vacuolar proton pump subunit H n=1 Tax=Stephania yunnanensis TaxID=152371 RepID=A0AAP0EEQ8_9MAGN
MPMDHAELTTEQVLKRDIPWETYMTTKLITGTCLQLLRRYDNKSGSYRAALLDDDGPAYVRVFINILRDIFKEDTVEYVLALVDEMLTANPRRARLFHDQSLANEDPYEPFLSARPNPAKCVIANGGATSNGEASHSKNKITTIDDVLKGLVEWLCSQLKKPSHPSRGVPTAISCLATLLREPLVRSSFVKADGVKLLVPLISPASTQQSIQLLYETCLCVWLLSYYEPAMEYLATSRSLPRLVEVVKGSTKEKVVRVIILTLRNLVSKGTFGAHMVDLGLLQIVQSLKAQAWSDEDLLEALNQLEVSLKDNIKKLSSFDKYKQEILLGQLDWSPMHKDPTFWRENITNFEENDFQILRVLITVLETSVDARALAVACHDLSQFIQCHSAGRIIVSDLKAKEKVMKLMNHENAEVTKNALLCVQRLFLVPNPSCRCCRRARCRHRSLLSSARRGRRDPAPTTATAAARPPSSPTAAPAAPASAIPASTARRSLAADHDRSRSRSLPFRFHRPAHHARPPLPLTRQAAMRIASRRLGNRLQSRFARHGASGGASDGRSQRSAMVEAELAAAQGGSVGMMAGRQLASWRGSGITGGRR